MKGCLFGAAAATLLCAAFIAIGQWAAPSLLPDLRLFSRHVHKGPQMRLRPAWPIQQELLQAVQRAASARGGVCLAVSFLSVQLRDRNHEDTGSSATFPWRTPRSERQLTVGIPCVC